MAEANVMRLFDGRKEVISRKKALENGLKRYYNGESCKEGHYSDRLVSTRQCLECVAISGAKWRLKDPDKIAKWQADRSCGNTLASVNAKRAGLRTYFTGKPCKNGHIAERLTINRCCVECVRAIKARRQKLGLNKVNPATRRIWWERQIETRGDEIRRKARDRARERWANDPEKARAKSREQQRKRREKSKEYINAVKRKHKNEANRIKRFRSISSIDQRVVISFAFIAHLFPEWFAAYLLALRSEYHKFIKEHTKTCQRSYQHNRRARVRNSEGEHTPDEVRRIREMQGDKCAMCKTNLRGKGHIDHIVPVSKGGSNYARNLQLLCQPCNQQKHARDPIEFAQSKGFLL